MEASEQRVIDVKFISYSESVPELFDALGAGGILSEQKQVLIKPNLINTSPPPVTTPAECCQAVIEYVRRHSKAEIIIAEGCGDPDYDTFAVFQRLGYSELAKRLQVNLLDLNKAPNILFRRNDCRLFTEMYLPDIIRGSYIISVPVLKAHSLAGITGTLKNMMGFLPPEHYQRGGHWKKSAFHADIHHSITELNRYVTADLTLLDARIGLAEYHLGGAECSPRVGKLVAGFDPLAVDRKAAELLGIDKESIPHLAI